MLDLMSTDERLEMHKRNGDYFRKLDQSKYCAPRQRDQLSKLEENKLPSIFSASSLAKQAPEER